MGVFSTGTSKGPKTIGSVCMHYVVAKILCFNRRLEKDLSTEATWVVLITVLFLINATTQKIEKTNEMSFELMVLVEFMLLIQNIVLLWLQVMGVLLNLLFEIGMQLGGSYTKNNMVAEVFALFWTNFKKQVHGRIIFKLKTTIPAQ